MLKVRRYRAYLPRELETCKDVQFIRTLVEPEFHTHGEWVSYEDYLILNNEVDRLTNELHYLKEIINSIKLV